jgi:hypothetical protein
MSAEESVDARFREICFEIMTLAQSYVNSGQDSPDMRNAMHGIVLMADVTTLALRSALQPRT